MGSPSSFFMTTFHDNIFIDRLYKPHKIVIVMKLSRGIFETEKSLILSAFQEIFQSGEDGIRTHSTTAKTLMFTAFADSVTIFVTTFFKRINI